MALPSFFINRSAGFKVRGGRLSRLRPHSGACWLLPVRRKWGGSGGYWPLICPRWPSLLPWRFLFYLLAALNHPQSVRVASQTPLLLTLFVRLYLASLPHFLFTSLLPHEGREVWWHSHRGTAAEEENRGKENNEKMQFQSHIKQLLHRYYDCVMIQFASHNHPKSIIIPVYHIT